MNIRLALLGLALAGCLSATQRREEDLIQNARMAADDLRWARWDQLGSSMPAEEKRLFLERVDLVGSDLVMCDYEVKNIHFDTGSSVATVTVAIEWYGKSDPSLHNATLEQRWENRNGRWMIVKQRRSHGDRFPLVTEPVAKPAPM
ncbi:MAG: hypothetical protein ABSF35_08720 [Polyangia bacterium]